MKIEKINENKIKIMFDSKELEENHISLHSFLSNSIEAQKLFLAILDIADEEFGFDTKNSYISSETLSFSNKNFVIIVTKSEKQQISNTSSHYNLLELVDTFDNSTESCSSTCSKNILGKKITSNTLIYKFENLDEVIYFANYIEDFENFKNIPNFLYQYNDSYFIVISVLDLEDNIKNKIIIVLSEMKNNLELSELSYIKLKESSNLLIEKNAIEILTNKEF